MDEMIVGLEDWTKILVKMICPKCDEPISRLYNGDRATGYACNKCKVKFVATSQKPTPKQKETVLERYRRSLLNGSSLTEPLSINFFCEVCRTQALERLAQKNVQESERDMALSMPTGDEGYVSLTLPNPIFLPHHSLITDPQNIIPMTCLCGKRYFLQVHFQEILKENSQVFECDLGHHNKCFGCPHSWDKYLETNAFVFRCDFNLNCPIIEQIKHKFRLHGYADLV